MKMLANTGFTLDTEALYQTDLKPLIRFAEGMVVVFPSDTVGIAGKSSEGNVFRVPFDLARVILRFPDTDSSLTICS
jgi:hypothetical protein